MVHITDANISHASISDTQQLNQSLSAQNHWNLVTNIQLDL